MTRRPLMLIALIALILSSAALAVPSVLAQTPAKPVISAKVGDKTFKGTAGSFCWPDDSGTPQCDVVDDPQPTAEIALAADGTITFAADPAVEKIDVWQVALLDTPDSKGAPQTVDILPSKGVFNPAGVLKPGKQRLQVQLFTNNQDYFVFYVFLVNYAGGAAGSNPTVVAVNPTPAPGATEAATAAQPAATSAATEAAPVAETMAATVAATPAATSPAGSIEVSTAEATSPSTTATSATGATGATAAATVAATQAPAVTSAATGEATTPPPMAASVTPLPSPTPAPATPTTPPTPTRVPPTATPVPPTATPAPPTATYAIAPNADVPAPDKTFPAAILVIGSTEYKPIAIEGCLIKPDARTCLSGAVNGTTPLAEGKAGADTLFVFKGGQPGAVKLSVRAADGIKVIAESTLSASNVVLSSLPQQAGNYILALHVTYDGGDVTYFFRVSVS